MKSMNRFPFDKALELRARGLAAVSIDTTTPAFNLHREVPYVHGSDRPLHQDVAVVFTVESIGPVTDETFALQVLLDDAANLPSPTVVFNQPITAPGVYVALVDIQTAAKLAGGNANRFLAARVDVAGTAPSIAFNVYLAPVRD